MSQQSQDTQVVLNVVTDQKLEQALTEQWAAFKVWMQNNIDNSNLMGIVKTYLDQANRQVLGTTGTAKAQAIEASVGAMVMAFQNAGIVMTDKKTSDFAALINSLTANSGVFILDSDGISWKPEDWGSTETHTSSPVGVEIITATERIIISHKPLPETSADEEVVQWGTYNVSVAPVEAFSGLNSSPLNGLNNTLYLLCHANPDVLIANPNQWTMQGSSSMTKAQVKTKKLVYFTGTGDYANILLPWAQALGTLGMAEIGSNVGFAVPNDAAATTYKIYYYNGTSSVSFGTRVSSTPYSDQNRQVGSNVARRCFLYKAYTGDTHQWYCPSMHELFLMFLNFSAINTALGILGSAPLTANYYWSCIQSNNYIAYALQLGSGATTEYSKSNSYRLRAVTRV